jgi:hypothetical protein
MTLRLAFTDLGNTLALALRQKIEIDGQLGIGTGTGGGTGTATARGRTHTATATPPTGNAPIKRVMSAAGRKRIATATKARWAKVRAEKLLAQKPKTRAASA